MKKYKISLFWISLSIGLSAQAAEPLCAARAGRCLNETASTQSIKGNTANDLAATGDKTSAAETKPEPVDNLVFVVNAIGTRTRVADVAIVQRDDRYFYVVSHDSRPAQKPLHRSGSVSEPEVVSAGQLSVDKSLFRTGSGERRGP